MNIDERVQENFENNEKNDELKKEEQEKTEKAPEITAEQYNELKKAADNYLDLLRRCQSEFDNFKKKLIKDNEQFIKYANEKLILELIDVYENLQRAIDAVKTADANENKESVLKGLELTFNQLKHILENHGLQPIRATGEKFDAYKHEAMMTTPTDEFEENTIIEEFQKGYTLNGKVIRYSKVRVAKTKENNQN